MSVRQPSNVEDTGDDVASSQITSQPSILTAMSGLSNDESRGQRAMPLRRDSQIMDDQLPNFMRINEKKHQHRHHYRAALQRQLDIKNHAIIFVSEFVGTVLFLFFGLGIVTEAIDSRASARTQGINPTPDTSALLFASLGFGFSLAVNAWTFYRISGGLFNPAVTLALYLTGTLTFPKLINLSIAQYAAGIASAGMVAAILPGNINARTVLAAGTNVAQGFWLEWFLTFQLILVIFLLAGEKHKGTFLAPVGIGLALFITQLLGINYTGASLNPCRTLGPNVITGKWNTYDWIYWIAPYTAAIVASGFYWALKFFQYESANMGQDHDDGRQVFRDMYGNVIGVLETTASADFHFIKPERTASSNNESPQLPPPGGLSTADQVKETTNVARANKPQTNEVNNDVA